MNRNNNIFAITMLVAIFAVATSFALAAPNAPTSLDPISSTSRDLSTLPAVSAEAMGGNVTEININTITVTKSWQGYYGNVSGTVVLQDANSNTFYNWTSAHAKGEVYATRASSIAWGSVACASNANVSLEETSLSQTAADADSVSNTYSQASHPTFTSGTVTFNANTCTHTTFGYVNNGSQAASYSMVLLQSNADIIYATITNSSTVGFDGRQHDFELMVGENGRTHAGVTNYYFWTEFD